MIACVFVCARGGGLRQNMLHFKRGNWKSGMRAARLRAGRVIEMNVEVESVCDSIVFKCFKCRHCFTGGCKQFGAPPTGNPDSSPTPSLSLAVTAGSAFIPTDCETIQTSFVVVFLSLIFDSTTMMLSYSIDSTNSNIY